MAVNTALSFDEAALHGVWTADALAASVGPGTVASGHHALDAELPSGGWPLGALIELLQPAPEAAVWSLLLPAAVARQQASGGAVVLVNPPYEPFLPPMMAGGVAAQRLFWLRGSKPAAQLWGAEQALRCADVSVVLAWLPSVRIVELRRLQQAAAQTGALLFVLRPDGSAADTATPARLRLRVTSAVRTLGRPRLCLVGEGDEPMADAADTLPQLRVDLLKRRGPPLTDPLWLPAHNAAVGALARAALNRSPPYRLSRGQSKPQEERHALAGLAVGAA